MEINCLYSKVLKQFGMDCLLLWNIYELIVVLAFTQNNSSRNSFPWSPETMKSNNGLVVDCCSNRFRRLYFSSDIRLQAWRIVYVCHYSFAYCLHTCFSLSTYCHTWRVYDDKLCYCVFVFCCDRNALNIIV